MRKLLIVGGCALAFAGNTAAAFAANPPGSGQPNQSCETSQPGPAGFNSGGFANAEAHYAGNGAGSLNANSGKAVSQYDVACYQVSQH